MNPAWLTVLGNLAAFLGLLACGAALLSLVWQLDRAAEEDR